MSHQSSNTVEVIGAGWGRTGTASLKMALERLGYNPTYHMFEVIKRKHGDFWIRVADKKPYDFDEAFVCSDGTKYTATVDFPSSAFWKEQLERYPNAKVILTYRDPEKWYQSCSDTIFRLQADSPHCSFPVAVMLYSPFAHEKQEFFYKVISRDSIHNDWSKKNVIACYKAHIDRVKRECPSDKLLIYEVSQGWEPLCKFLNKPIPQEPFPHVNDTAMFQKKIQQIKLQGYTLLTLAVLLPVGVAFLVKKYYFKL